MTYRTLVPATVLALLPTPAFAGAPMTLYPERLGAETARFERGDATVSLKLPSGTVQIRPMPVEKGRVAFSVAVFNDSRRSANFGPENISATVNGVPVAIPTHDQLAQQAQDKARAARIGTALVAGVLAGAASTASNHGTYYRRVGGPHHGYVQAIHWEDNTPGIVGAAAAVAGGALVIKGIDDKLDYTLQQLGGEALQTTTIDPGSTFGGLIVVPEAARGDRYAHIRIDVTFGGATYPFAFRLAPAGAPTAAPMPATQVSAGIDGEMP